MAEDRTLELVLKRVRLRAQRRLAWLRHIRAEPETTPPDMLQIVLEDRDNPADEAAWYAGTPDMHSLNAAIADTEAALEAITDSRLGTLCTQFGLEAIDRDVLHVCLAAALDDSLRAVYAVLQGDADADYPTEPLVARLFDYGRHFAWDNEAAPRLWEMVSGVMVRPGAPPALLLDSNVRDWLLGHALHDTALIGHAHVLPPQLPLPDWPVADTAARLVEVLANGETARVTVLGLPYSGRRTFAAAVSAALGMPLLVVEPRGLSPAELRRMTIRANRQAFLQRCALAWNLPPETNLPTLDHLAAFPIQFLIRETGDDAPPPANSQALVVRLPAPGIDARRQLWEHYFPTLASSQPRDLELLSERYLVRAGDIARIASHATDDLPALAHALRESQRGVLGTLAKRLETPFTWDDLIVDERVREALEDLVFEAENRAAFWEWGPARRLFPHGRGLVALLSGPPGTGKTMAAQVLAGTLALDLYRIDLSAVVSKYVGETAKNLERVLARAAQLNVVLLFDEADTLFAKRTEIRDAHDRYANTDTNFLLQALEDYNGVALLATNKRPNIDPAFIRRLRYVLEFNRPDAGQRYILWEHILAELAGWETTTALRPALERLAQTVDVTGAQIKYAVLTAVFAAQRDHVALNEAHLLRGLNRELMKEGRALNAYELDKLLINNGHHNQ